MMNDESPKPDPSTSHIMEFLNSRSAIFRALVDLREKGWKNPEAETQFQKQRKIADAPSQKKKWEFFKQFQKVGDELQKDTGAFSLSKGNSMVLDICMAPGGFSVSVLEHSPDAHICGLTLLLNDGGYGLKIPFGKSDPRVEVRFADITMFAAEFGVTDIPKDHPESSKFSQQRPWATKSFDLVICDGQNARPRMLNIAAYRQNVEDPRLAYSQLMLAMQRIKAGGTFIMLLHKVEMWESVKLLSLFDKISHIELFKPTTSHQNRSSFYLVAKNVQPQQPEAVAASSEWKQAWKDTTFPDSSRTRSQDEADSTEGQTPDQQVDSVLETFGERLIELGEPVWEKQTVALEEAKYNKKIKPAGNHSIERFDDTSSDFGNVCDE